LILLDFWAIQFF